MADVTRMPSNSFGYVPTPALVAPIEDVVKEDGLRRVDRIDPSADPVAQHNYRWKDR